MGNLDGFIGKSFKDVQQGEWAAGRTGAMPRTMNDVRDRLPDEYREMARVLGDDMAMFVWEVWEKDTSIARTAGENGFRVGQPSRPQAREQCAVSRLTDVIEERLIRFRPTSAAFGSAGCVGEHLPSTSGAERLGVGHRAGAACVGGLRRLIRGTPRRLFHHPGSGGLWPGAPRDGEIALGRRCRVLHMSRGLRRRVPGRAIAVRQGATTSHRHR